MEGCRVFVKSHRVDISGRINSHAGCVGLSAEFVQSCGLWRVVSRLSVALVIAGTCQEIVSGVGGCKGLSEDCQEAVMRCETEGGVGRGQRQAARDRKHHHPALINPLMTHVMSRGIRFTTRSH